MLKVFCGGLFSGNFRIPELGPKMGKPLPHDLLRILFEGEPLRSPKGLYLASGKSGIVETDHRILKASVLYSTIGLEAIVGLRVWMFGLEFGLMAFGVSFTNPPKVFEYAACRPAGFVAEGNNVRIQFAWRDGPGSAEAVFTYLGERPNS
jgi:hypothetical protein